MSCCFIHPLRIMLEQYLSPWYLEQVTSHYSNVEFWRSELNYIIEESTVLDKHPMVWLCGPWSGRTMRSHVQVQTEAKMLRDHLVGCIRRKSQCIMISFHQPKPWCAVSPIGIVKLHKLAEHHCQLKKKKLLFQIKEDSFRWVCCCIKEDSWYLFEPTACQIWWQTCTNASDLIQKLFGAKKNDVLQYIFLSKIEASLLFPL